MKKDKIIYWVSTGIMLSLFLFSAGLYLFNTDYVREAYRVIEFPTWIIYPLATLKILGVIAVLTKKSRFLKEMAYAGFFFDVLFAVPAHIMVNDGDEYAGIIGIIAVTISWIYDRKVYPIKS
ncbi:MAG: hypothetical protein CMH46_03180 [Muricauda sp.]|nr:MULTISPECIES: DoxX family protein [unclassified Allomuricauda]MAU14523.1 hypothetical protein [Allomuricauda sp.]|tara:strand:- start:19553 stop:19918 length:366 start_codon:yes stop_codon:yes gene_type:complete